MTPSAETVQFICSIVDNLNMHNKYSTNCTINTDYNILVNINIHITKLLGITKIEVI